MKDLNSNIDALKGREITFAGMVTEAFETVGKTGKPYSKLTLADYEDSYTLFFFGKDYVEFGKFCKPNIFIMVKGVVQESFRGGLEYRVRHVEIVITSYSIHYTKLYEERLAFPDQQCMDLANDQQEDFFFKRGEHELKWILAYVITSYSIHYTKLYETRCPRVY